MRKILLIILLLLSGGAAVDSNAAEQTWKFNLKDVDIRDFVEQVSAITGENFVVDSEIKNKVTVISATPLDKDGVLELFLSVLRVNGFAAIASKNFTKIVAQSSVKQNGVAAGGNISGEQIVTKIIPIKNADISELVKILRPLVSQYGYLEGSAFSHSLIITDYGDHVNRIAQMIADLDRSESNDVDVVPLREAWVGAVIPLIEKLAPLQLGEGEGKSRNRVRVVADERSNSIIIKGERSERETIRELAEKLDQKSSNSSGIHVIPLHHADAKQVAALLTAVLSGDKKAVSAPSPARAAPMPSAPDTGAPGSPPGANGAASSTQAPSDDTFGAPANNDPGLNKSFLSNKGNQISIQPDTVSNSLIIRAEPSVMGDIETVVKQLDVRRAQVLIEAAIIEISSDLAEQLGVQLSAGDFATGINGAANANASNGVDITSMLTQLGKTKASILNPAGFTGAFGAHNIFNVLIQALSSTTGANLLSTPSITTLDNEQAKIVVGQNVPFKTGSYTTTASGASNPFTTIDRQDVGITLKVVPQIHEGNTIRLNIEQEVSSIAASSDQAADIITNKRTIQTNVLADNGEIIVLGGLMEDDTNDSVGGIPWLSDLPVVGALFRSTSRSHTKQNLLVFLRPIVLRDKEAIDVISQNKFEGIQELNLDYVSKNGKGLGGDNATKLEALFDAPDSLPSKHVEVVAPAPLIGAAGNAQQPSPGTQPYVQLPWLVKTQ